MAVIAENLTLIAPALMANNDYSEIELLGSAVWLWGHCDPHREAPISALYDAVYPPIGYGQCAFIIENKRPVGYVSWAMLNEVTERHYLHTRSPLKPQQWRSGDRLWIIDWITPFGHSYPLMRLVQQRILTSHWGRFLYHRGGEKGLKIKTFFGAGVAVNDARKWFSQHPVML